MGKGFVMTENLFRRHAPGEHPRPAPQSLGQFSLRSLRSLRLNQSGNRKALTTKNAKNAERNRDGSKDAWGLMRDA